MNIYKKSKEESKDIIWRKVQWHVFVNLFNKIFFKEAQGKSALNVFKQTFKKMNPESRLIDFLMKTDPGYWIYEAFEWDKTIYPEVLWITLETIWDEQYYPDIDESFWINMTSKN